MYLQGALQMFQFESLLMRIIHRQYRNLSIGLLLTVALMAALALCKSQNTENSLASSFQIL